MVETADIYDHQCYATIITRAAQTIDVIIGTGYNLLQPEGTSLQIIG